MISRLLREVDFDPSSSSSSSSFRSSSCCVSSGSRAGNPRPSLLLLLSLLSLKSKVAGTRLLRDECEGFLFFEKGRSKYPAHCAPAPLPLRLPPSAFNKRGRCVRNRRNETDKGVKVNESGFVWKGERSWKRGEVS